MKSVLAMMIVFAGAALAQQPSGEVLFAKTCGTGYCHASKGVGGGAPRLAARGFAADYIRTVVTSGIQGTAMSAYGTTWPKRDLDAVIGYVASLNGITGAGAAQVARKTYTGVAEHGRMLFSEATRSFGRCSTCHQQNGIGIAVAPPISQVPASVAALKNLATPNVKTARMSKDIPGDSMPALLVAKRASEVLFYDLTPAPNGAPPVLRTAAPGDVQITDGSQWKHSSALGSYTDTELAAILAYLR